MSSASEIVSNPTAFSLWSWFVLGSQLVGGVLVTLTVVLYLNQEKMLYMPNQPGAPRTPDENPPGWRSPGDWTIAGQSNRGGVFPIPYEDHMIKTADNIGIHAWLLLQENSEHFPTVIYFHGNAGNMGFRLKNAARMYAMAKVNILMVDYRGYGKSEGSPNEKGLQLDAEASLRFVQNHPKLQGSQIIMFGRSLGGAVGIYLAEKYPDLVKAVIVENTFLSVSAMVDVLMPFLTPLKQFVLNMKWNSDERISRITQPILFISGDKDELVPRAHMESLHSLAKASCQREFYSVAGGTHNDTWERGGTEYYQRIASFVKQFRSIPSLNTASKSDKLTEIEVANIAGTMASVPPEGQDEDDFFIVNADQIHIPTMGADFSVQ